MCSHTSSNTDVLGISNLIFSSNRRATDCIRVLVRDPSHWHCNVPCRFDPRTIMHSLSEWRRQLPFRLTPPTGASARRKLTQIQVGALWFQLALKWSLDVNTNEWMLIKKVCYHTNYLVNNRQGRQPAVGSWSACTSTVSVAGRHTASGQRD